MPDIFNISALPVNETILWQMGRKKASVSGEIKLDLTYLFNAPNDSYPITMDDLKDLVPAVVREHQKLKRGEGDCLDGGITMLGWMSLPETMPAEHIKHIQELANELADKIDAFVSLGIGGSYLGIEATCKALTHTHWNQLSRQERGGRPEIYFLGQNMDPDFFRDTLDMLKGKRIGINVISKSGTTTETAIAFRILKQLMETSFGTQSRELTIATTDARRGALRKLAEQMGYSTLVVPDNVGGRFSIQTDVGLFGLAVAGIDIQQFLAGFRAMKRRTDEDDFWRNPAMLHASARFLAYQKGKKVEVIATNSAHLYHICRWMEQLFPESEGHKGKGMWVSPSLYSEKLHANGQMVQDGERNIFEVFLRLAEHSNRMSIPRDPEDLDGLNYLPDTGKDLNAINRLVIDGPAYAHYQGGVPNISIEVPALSAYHIGSLYFLLERSVAISGYLLGHNPFIQPGVEAYKKAVFALAGKPGYEKEGEKIGREMAGKERMIV